MALQRMRWTNTGADLIRSQARDGANLRSIAEPPAPRRRDVHIHIHGARTVDQSAPLRSPAPPGDQPTGGLPAVPRDQNTEPEEAGFKNRGIKLRGRDQAEPRRFPEN
jgi:hypothetical protein